MPLCLWHHRTSSHTYHEVLEIMIDIVFFNPLLKNSIKTTQLCSCVPYTLVFYSMDEGGDVGPYLVREGGKVDWGIFVQGGSAVAAMHSCGHFEGV